MQVATIAKPTFVVSSSQFGYPMWSADVPNRPDVEITDRLDEMAIFENSLAADCMAKALTKIWGYEWKVFTCVS